MTEEQIALAELDDAYRKLESLGWRDAVFCPKDGSTFYVIEAGSTGIHEAFYQGEWPNGGWWVASQGDLWPSRPILFKPMRVLV